jgi:hypothetical protein
MRVSDWSFRAAQGETRASVQQRARKHGIPGVYGNPGMVESVTYRFQRA